MKRFVMFIALFIAGIAAFAEDDAEKQFSKANVLYEAERFEEALEVYLSLQDTYESAELHFNTGNTYYRLNDHVNAILYYERAKKLAPGDEELQSNIDLTNSYFTDKTRPESLSGVEVWWTNLVYGSTPGIWTMLSVLLMVIAFGLLSLFIITKQSKMKKLGFFGGLVALPIALFFSYMSYLQQFAGMDNSSAIVIEESITAKGSPSGTSADVMILHEGTKVQILRESKSGWYEIKAPNGTTAWLEQASIAII